MALYKAYPAHIILLRRAFAVVAGVAALPVMLFLERSRPLLQLAAPGVVENQRTAGVDGAGGKSRSRFLLIRSAATKTRKPPVAPGGFFSSLVYTRFHAPQWNWQVLILPERAIFSGLYHEMSFADGY